MLDRLDPLKISLFWMTLSAIGFSMMSLGVRLLSDSVPQFSLVFFRSATNFLIAAVLAITWFRHERVAKDQLPLLVFRGLMGFGGVVCFFYGIRNLPMAVGTLINWSSPLFVLLFSWIFLKEKTRISAVFWILVSFLGLVLLVVQPGDKGAKLNLMALGIAWIGSAFAAFAYIAVRAATQKTGVNTIILFFSGIGSMLALPLMIQEVVHDSSWVTLSVIFKLLAMGVFASMGQYCMTMGYRYSAAGKVSAMALLNAAFGAFWGWVWFNEVLRPTQWFGAALIGVGIIGVTVGFSLKSKSKIS